MALADKIEAWWREQGKEVPARGTDEWKAMYFAWARWALHDAIDKRKSQPPICYWRF